MAESSPSIANTAIIVKMNLITSIMSIMTVLPFLLAVEGGPDLLEQPFADGSD